MQSDLTNTLPREFYTRNDVVKIAKDLLGKVIYTYFNKEMTSGIIIETEAYEGITDKASHAYNNRRTARTEIMYRNGGLSYVYLCYGIHSLFNVVTSVESIPHAVLIRAIEPLTGIEIMSKRKNKLEISVWDGIGPGNVSRLLGINVNHSGKDLCPGLSENRKIWIQDDNIIVPEKEIIISSRVGINYAEEDAKLQYRFQWIKSIKAP